MKRSDVPDPLAALTVLAVAIFLAVAIGCWALRSL